MSLLVKLRPMLEFVASKALLLLCDPRNPILSRIPELPPPCLERILAQRIELQYSHPQFRSLTSKELLILCGLAKIVNPDSILEIGTFEGTTTLNLALNTKASCKIVTIDLRATDWGVLEKSGCLMSRIQQVVADSTKFDFSQPHSHYDFIFIDGAHDFGSIQSDTEQALRLLSDNGMIVWHDYMCWRLFKGTDVPLFLNKLSEELPLRRVGKSSFIVYDRPGILDRIIR